MPKFTGLERPDRTSAYVLLDDGNSTNDGNDVNVANLVAIDVVVVVEYGSICIAIAVTVDSSLAIFSILFRIT